MDGLYNSRSQGGATVDDIQFHYDLSRDFYQVWLDESLTYSCAMFEDSDTLETAQQRKIDYHIKNAEIHTGNRVLDFGCGWGSSMFRLVNDVPGSHCVGLTLSADQKDYIDAQANDRIKVKIDDLNAIEDDFLFDAVISIGAFEHLARPEMDAQEKIATYRDFFRK